MQATVNECSLIFIALWEDIRNRMTKLVKFSESELMD